MRGPVDHLLAVVQDHHRIVAAEFVGQSVLEIADGNAGAGTGTQIHLADTESRRDGGKYVLVVAHRRQRHEVDRPARIGEFAPEPLSDPRLADAAGTLHGDEPVRVDEAQDGGHIVVTTDQCGCVRS